ncbi:MAG: FAD-dependent monooxygenase, partial [Candidatus Binatia bacterium]
MPYASTQRDPILIVGGGPTGTTLAIELLRRGVPCRVIDRLDGPVMTSRSFTLHARTLELFEMAGFVDAFLERGIRSVSMDYRFQGVEEIARLDFTALESQYPFTLIINQDVTEAVLREHLARLGTQVEWNVELRSLSHDGNGRVTAVLVHQPEGREEVVQTDWLIGCDGVHSVVRKQLDLPYEGDDYTGMELRMMDVQLSGFPLTDDSIHYLITKEHLLLITKLPGLNYRVLISDMGGAQATDTVRSAFQRVVDEHFRGSVTLGEPEWATVFRIWRRIVTSYRQGHIFLVGDAAHCHSPAGGQGMNACIQDAFNLGWKLALVARGEAHESLLDSYEPERRPIGQQVIEATHLLNTVIMAHGTSIEDRIAITKEPGFNQRAVSKVSGLAYTYRDVVTAPPGLTPLDGPAAGDRALDAPLTTKLRLHDLLRHPDHTLLLFPGEANAAQALAELARRVTERFG